METIEISNKTFCLYRDGIRTFIHIPKTTQNLELKEKLKFGESVCILNKETKEKIEETFWFTFNFKENPRFLILVFKGGIKDDLFSKRKQNARRLNIENKYSFTEYFDYSSDYPADKMISYSSLMAYSSLFFINSDNFFLPGYQMNILNVSHVSDMDSNKTKSFIVLDILKLKKERGGMFEIYSLFPCDLFYV